MERMRAGSAWGEACMPDSRANRTLPQLLACTAAAAISLSATAHAQAVQGTVVDAAGRPLPDAVVILMPLESRTTTDTRGRFSFGPTRAGDYVLRVRLIGYRPLERAVRHGRVSSPVRIVMARMPQVLDTVRISDQDGCHTTSLAGFECRRASGEGYFRDAVELRALKPRYWADMLDGIPGVRRTMKKGPYGLDWRPEAPPSRCFNELWNGQPPMRDSGAPHQPDEYWKPIDVVAIEVYDEYVKVPARYRAYAWPPFQPQCGIIIYWLRGASKAAPTIP